MTKRELIPRTKINSTSSVLRVKASQIAQKNLVSFLKLGTYRRFRRVKGSNRELKTGRGTMLFCVKNSIRVQKMRSAY